MLMINNVKKTINAYNMIEKGDRILVAVSGGADSICLLCVLMMLKEEYLIELFVIHINHHLRGEDSEGDEDYVRRFCEDAEIAYTIKHADVYQEADNNGWSIEEAGRNIRYRLFHEASQEFKCNKTASAHHQDDTTETVLLNMFRGTGVKGMCGIPPVRGSIIRPLIHVSRREIEEFLLSNHITWRIDKSNYSNDYTRNKIRNNIMPYAKNEINSNASVHIADLSKQMMELYDYVSMESDKAYHKTVIEVMKDTDTKSSSKEDDKLYSKTEKEYKIDIIAFKEYNTVIRREIIFKVLEKCRGGRKNIESAHILDIEQLINRQSGKIIVLPEGLSAIREFNEIIITKAYNCKSYTNINITIKIPGIYSLPLMNKNLRIDIINYNKSDNIPKNDYTKWFDYDKINNAVKLRTRMESDFITINKTGGRKSIKALYIEKKVSKSLRDEILILADGSSILWVPGIRSSEGYYIDDGTKRVLTVEII